MPATEKALARLNVFLLKEPVPTTVVDAKGATETRCPDLGKSAVLFARQVPSRPPKWLSFLAPIAKGATDRLRSSSASALLLVPAGKRTFALAFGHGKSLLEPSSWEENFGLRVTLNSIDPATLRSVDMKELDPLTRHSRVNASRSGELAAFGFDPGQDMLRAVTGTPSDQTLGVRMTGMDSLAVNVRAEALDLPALLARYVDLFESDDYRATFPQIDNIREVRDRKLTDELDELMVAKVRAREFETTWLAISAPIDWTAVAGFTYRKNDTDDLIDDVHMDTFLATVRDIASITPDFLYQRRIWPVSGDGDLTGESWSVYNSIYSEVEHGGEDYLLTDGRWYRLEKDYVAEVNAYVQRVAAKSSLPECTQVDEGAYNKHVVKTNANYTLLDRKLISYGGGRSRIEFCDLLGKDGRVVHVKRYGGSSTLSHLFAQGNVSANILFGDAAFRKEVDKLVPIAKSPWAPGKDLDPRSLTLVYAVIAKSKKSIDQCLPFFSKVVLYTAGTQLRPTRVKIALEKIQKT